MCQLQDTTFSRASLLNLVVAVGDCGVGEGGGLMLRFHDGRVVGAEEGGGGGGGGGGAGGGVGGGDGVLAGGEAAGG